MFPDQTILFECTGHCLDHAAHRNSIKINLRLAAYLLSECIQDFLNHDRWRTSVVSTVRSASSRELQPLRICICYSLVKFSRLRAALWLATVECSFYKRRSSWCGRGNGKSQLAECATEIAGECVDEKHFTPWKPISRCSRVVRPSFATTEAVAATRPLASGIKWDFTGAWTATALRRIPRWRKRQLRNAKPPPCCCNSARFTSELRVASEPCESRESTSWRSSIGNWENIAIGEANLRNETLHGEQMTSNNLSILSYSSWLYYKHMCLAFIGSFYFSMKHPVSLKQQ